MDLAPDRGVLSASATAEPPCGATGALQFPGRLYGREKAFLELRAALGRRLENGEPRLILVAGEAGVGKTSLVARLEPPLRQRHGRFLVGRWRPLGEPPPYLGFTEALRALLADELAAGTERAAACRQRLQAALGATGKPLTRLLPELAQLLGPQPEPPEIPESEAEYRFAAIFTRLVASLASPERPLLLFLDNLQWADPASLRLLQALARDASLQHVCLIGAFRSEEAPPGHPLASTLARLAADGTSVHLQQLQPLGQGELGDFLAATLCREAGALRPLVATVHARTAGNPLFVVEYLKALHDDRLLVREPEGRYWLWDEKGIEADAPAVDVVDFLRGRLGRLPPLTQAMLALGACIGSDVEPASLAELVGESEAEIDRRLRPAWQAGMLLPVAGGYRFRHDHLQTAAYALVAEAERASIHWQIGRLQLLIAEANGALERHLFAAVGQLLRGASILAAPGERRWLAQLALQAGIHARSVAAHCLAADYLRAGIGLLPADAWDSAHMLAYTLHAELARAEWLDGDISGALVRTGQLLAHVRDDLRQADLYRLQSKMHAAAGRLEPAIAAGLAALRLLGIELSSRPTAATVEREYERVWSLLGERSIESLAELPPMQDPHMQLAIETLEIIGEPAFSADAHLVELVGCVMTSLSLVHGNADASATGYAAFGRLLGARHGRNAEGKRFDRLACELAEKRQRGGTG